jgi:hypothetical protein
VIEADSGKAVAVEMSGAGYALLGDGGSCAARWRVIAGSAR